MDIHEHEWTRSEIGCARGGGGMTDPAEVLAELAMSGAADMLRHRGITPTDDQYAAIVAKLRELWPTRIDGMLADGKAALDAGMTDVAAATVALSARLVGVDAVRAVFPD